MIKIEDFKAMPLPEDFGSMDHLHEATQAHCDMMKMFEINTRLARKAQVLYYFGEFKKI